jgi:translocation and assembly module TamA
LFDSATVEFDPDPARAAATPIRVKVHELSQHQATAGVGISANVGPRVSLEHAFRRPFGLYATARNKIELARDRRAWESDLTSHPLPDHYRNLLSAKVERLDAADDVRTTWSARAGRSQQTARIERLYFGEIVSSKTVSAVARERGNASSLNYHWLGRRVDDVLLPTRGFTLALQGAGGYAISDFARSGPFGRAWARLNGYVPLGSVWHVESRLELGQVVATNGVGLPDTVLFRAGGDDSVRGYAYRTLGPLDNGVVTSGRVLMTASLELARPLSLSRPWLWGALFVDAGRAANDWNSLDPAFGYGAGLRWRSPVGPLRVDLAYGQEVRRLRLHVSVGVAL